MHSTNGGAARVEKGDILVGWAGLQGGHLVQVCVGGIMQVAATILSHGSLLCNVILSQTQFLLFVLCNIGHAAFSSFKDASSSRATRK